jgi:hypothetical protein
LNTGSSNPAQYSARRGDARHPVLARLPDVSDQLSSASRSTRAAEAGFVNYRFDGPAQIGADSARRSQARQPHVFQRSQTDYRMRSLRDPSRILPDSDLFALPTTSVVDRLAPAVRFLTLFALFTAIGTTYLMNSGNDSKATKPERRPHSFAPATTATRHSSETAEVDQPPASAPTAIGPLGAHRESITEADLTAGEENPAITSAPAMPMPTLALANGAPLPQVQTSDAADAGVVSEAVRLPAPEGPPAIARLPGYILESSSRQPHHDQNQPGLH